MQRLNAADSYMVLWYLNPSALLFDIAIGAHKKAYNNMVHDINRTADPVMAMSLLDARGAIIM